MAQTFQQLQKQIEALQAKAEQIRRGELKEVIAKIKVAIDAYGISKHDLFGPGPGPVKGKSAKKTGGAARSGAAKYSDGKGNSWVGLGKRPQWLRDALAAGRSLDDFLTQASPAAAESGSANAPVASGKKPSPGKAGKAKYRDEAGNTWSGRGPRPRWFKDALAAGKSPEDLMA